VCVCVCVCVCVRGRVCFIDCDYQQKLCSTLQSVTRRDLKKERLAAYKRHNETISTCINVLAAITKGK